MTEKRKPTHDLEAFKKASKTIERLNATTTALRSAAAFGFGPAKIVSTIQTMQRENFYKSMTAYNNHRDWQDVYHVPSEAGLLYVKFTAHIVKEFMLLSFKEKSDE